LSNKAQVRNLKNLILLIIAAGITSCGSGKKPVQINSSAELSEVSKMAYFPPVFHFTSGKKANLPTPKKYIFRTTEAVDSILNSNKEYRIDGRLQNATIPHVNTIFEQLHKGNADPVIPAELQAQMNSQPNRYVLGLQFDPHFVLWRSTERIPYHKPRDGLIFRSSRLNVFVLDTESLRIIFYGSNMAKSAIHPTWNAIESIDLLYKKMFSEFDKD
jgi:hypothetical protein